MDERAIVAELVRWLLGIPADRVTWHHVALMAAGFLIWVVPAAFRFAQHVATVRFIRTATPEQLAAYTGKLPPPKPPSLGGPAVMLALLCLLGLTGRDANSAQIAAAAAPGQPVKNCCKDCEPPSRCVRCHCEAKGKQDQTEQPPQRDERLTTTRPPFESSVESYPARYVPLWQRELPES